MPVVLMLRISKVHGDLKAVSTNLMNTIVRASEVRFQMNILVSGDGVLKITDFGSSVLLDPSLAFSATSLVGGGTTRWMVSIYSSRHE